MIPFFIVVMDQVTKQWVLQHLNYGIPNEVFPWLNLTLVYNKGVSFGLMNTGTFWYHTLILLLSGGITLLLFIWLMYLPNRLVIKKATIALILGGAIGNLIDRIWYGHVIDFVDIFYRNWHWYYFNIADIFITCGAVLLGLLLLLSEKEVQK